MNSAVYDVLFNATKEVFRLMLDLDEVSPADGEGSRDGVSVVIPVVGDIEGEIVYYFSKRTALGAVEIMSGMDIEDVDEFVSSAICEIANIISGKTMAALSERQIACDIRPPRFLTPEEEPDTEGAERVLVNTDIGDIEMRLLLKETAVG